MTNANPVTIETIIQRLRDFASERDWDQFHSPKNLAMALTVEAAELQEIFQWLTPEEAAHLDPAQHQHAAEEIADVLLYLLRLSDKLGIDVLDAAVSKMAKNALKYPVEMAKGSHKKALGAE
ncbi:nucleotide pyrophosphohydrolase [Leeia sp. TBRC 13508]|uniref:Nucleotide pyrophosphohydrolase n=1 Tax=Leeia speluncae TaxID=2884804 RepID=A0ABS8D4L3_9NEIS|nr:nucleotide pyrophosphohydrolase [Leeia speluncae]MCB6183149.1 nucleotide pyrophosphohydrolase [Leeia speluncae]